MPDTLFWHVWCHNNLEIEKKKKNQRRDKLRVGWKLEGKLLYVKV